MAKGEWSKFKDELGWIHLLDTGEEGYSLKVEKSTGGDYFVTAMHEDDIAGGEVDYEDNLIKAKKLAEKYLTDGTWRDLLLEE
jgi:hypothetical protein